MRDKNYRRKQEAKHYNARLSILSYGNLKLLKSENLTEKEERNRKRLIHKLKTGDLKFGMLDKWSKRFSNKSRRQFQKRLISNCLLMYFLIESIIIQQ